MGIVKSLNKWANAHTYYPIDIMRIALGVFLFIKGTSFVRDSDTLLNLIRPLRSFAGAMVMVHYIAPAHMLGGILIVFGFFTRWSIIAQLPILIGAILINFTGNMNVNNLVLSSVIFIICIFFLIYGSGKNSADYYFKLQK